MANGNPANFPLERVEDLYLRGLYLQAWQEGSQWGELREWPTTAGQVAAGKLAIHLGAPRLGLRLQARAWQKDRGNYYAAYYYGWHVLQYRGPLAAWDFAENYPDRPEVEGWMRADMLGLRSRCATYLRDFQTADALLRQAEEISPGMAWLHVERASLLESQDRLEEALEAAEKAFAIVPYYRPAVQAKAQFLQHLNRDDEALAFLKAAMAALESGAVAAQLFQLQIELEQRGDTVATLEQFARLNPLMEQATREWIEYRRCEEPYFSGAMAQAAEAGERLESKDSYYSAFVQRVRDLASTGQQPERRILPMGFVRQHHLTCVPATLTSIARYWGRPADHLEVAEKICYDGTSGLSERLWTEQNGFTAREFTITPEAVRTLVDRGVPFTVTTVEATNGHLQAGIGYDLCRQSVFVRDPSHRSKTEFVMEPFCARYASSGPRGMAICPREESERLANVELPDAELFDLNHGLSVALEENDRERAQRFFDGMLAAQPEHRLTLGAKRTLANYDGNTHGQLEAVDSLLRLFPGAPHLQLGRLSLLRALGRREEMIQWLKELSLKPETDAALLQEYANELTHDARAHAQGMQFLKRARRVRRADGINLFITAHIHWQSGEFERAALLYRFALCLNDRNEAFANSYFIACRHLGRTQEALKFLADRFERFGGKSSAPARTLFEAHEQMELMSAGFAILERAAALRPADADLMLFMAQTHGRYGNLDRANELLAAAQPLARRHWWLRTAAGLKEFSNDPLGALGHWMELLEQDPLGMEAIRAAALLLAQTRGNAAAREFLKERCERFPHHFPLHQLIFEHSSDEPLAERATLIERLLALSPNQIWVLRELAKLRVEEQNMPAAREALEQAIAIDPNDSWTHSHIAWLWRRLGDVAEALRSYRRAVELSIENSHAVEALVETAQTLAEKKAELAWLDQNFSERRLLGAGVLSFPGCAAGILPPEDVEGLLKRLREKHPDAWEALSALGSVLADAQRLDEALVVAATAAERFPLLPRVWRDLARIRRSRMEHEDEVAALRKGLKINHRWDALWIDLALACERAGRPAESIQTIEKALLQNPRNGYLQALLGDFRLRYGPAEGAIEPLKLAVEFEPNHRWAWDLMDAAAEKFQQPDLARDLARSLTKTRPGDVNARLVLIERLDKPEHRAERLEAIEEVIRLNPRNSEARIWKCIALVGERRFDEAKAAAAPTDWVGPLPPLLRARGAWITAATGDLPQGVRQMQAVLEDDPSLHWGWTQLCSWRLQMEDYEGAMEPVRALLRIDPHASVTHGYAGAVKLRADSRAEAKDHFRRALQLDPAYVFAGYQLAQAEIDDGNWNDASKVLDQMGPNADPVKVMEMRIGLAIAEGGLDAGLDLFRGLCESPSAEPGNILAAFHQLNLIHTQPMRRLLNDLIGRPGIHAIIGTAWTLNHTRNGHWWIARRVNRMRLAHGAAGKSAVISYLEELGGALAGNTRDLRRFCLEHVLRNNRAWLRDDDRGWGMVGYVLLQLRRHRHVVQWLENYATRPNVEPWILHNYIEACHVLGRDDQARAAGEFALALPFYGVDMNGLLVWGAIEAALAGDGDGARQSLSRVQASTITPREKTVQKAAELILEFQESASRRKCTAEDRKIMFDFYNAHPGNKWARRARKRFYRRLREKHGDWWSAWIPW